MTYKENIRAILECNFSGFKEEIIDIACNRILELEPCDDAISRQAVLDEAFEVDTKEYGRIDVVGVDVINSLPYVKPKEPKIGHWIEHPHEAGPCWEYSRYECSECHEWSEDDSDYCPDCGAKMTENENQESIEDIDSKIED